KPMTVSMRCLSERPRRSSRQTTIVSPGRAKSSIACALGTIIPDSTHHISVGSFDSGFHQRIFLERGGLLTFGDAHITNLHRTISSHSFFSMVLVRLYGNSWKWQLLRRYFAEWNNRMDQFGEMSKTKQVVHAETSRTRAS